MLGFNATKEEILKIWENNAKGWHSSSSPWRPSRSDVEIYEKLAGGKLRGSVLILGATPELRDLTGRYTSATLIDISPSMIFETTKLLKEADPTKEIWARADWCQAPLPENSFDVILGDMPWWVLSVNQQKDLCNKMASLLKPDGILITRIRLRDPRRSLDSLEITLEKYLEKLDENPNRRKFIRNAMVSHLHDITADTTNMRINREGTKRVLLVAAEHLTNPLHERFLLEAADHLLDADWTSQTREELLGILEKKFSIVAEANAADYESEYYPIMALKKNA